MANKRIYYRLFLILLILISLILISIQNFEIITGKIIYSTESNVSISKSLAISFSGNLSEGISFGTVEVLPSNNTNATANYIGSNNGTEYYINVSSNGNTAVDFCIKADGGMVNFASDVLGLGNETYSHSNVTNSSHPLFSNETLLTTGYVKSGENIPVGGSNYYRFWLDVPSAQPSGDYNNTLSFKGTQAGSSC